MRVVQLVNTTSSMGAAGKNVISKFCTLSQRFQVWSVKREGLRHEPHVEFEAWSAGDHMYSPGGMRGDAYTFFIAATVRSSAYVMRDLVDIFDSFNRLVLDELTKAEFETLNKFLMGIYNATNLTMRMDFRGRVAPQGRSFVDVDNVSARLKWLTPLSLELLRWTPAEGRPSQFCRTCVQRTCIWSVRAAGRTMTQLWVTL